MFGLGVPEIIVIFLVVFLLFGAKALPEIAKGLGQAMNIFKKEVKSLKENLDEESSAKRDTSNDFDPSAERPDWRPKNKV